MFFQRTREYLIIIFIAVLVCRSYIFHMDKLYFSTYLNVTSFRTFPQVSLSRCIYECKTRLRCDAINYSSTWKLCALISEPLILSGDSRNRSAVARKSDWFMVNILSLVHFLCSKVVYDLLLY